MGLQARVIVKIPTAVLLSFRGLVANFGSVLVNGFRRVRGQVVLVLG